MAPRDLGAAADLSAAVDLRPSPYAGVACGDGGCADPAICCLRPTGGVSFTQACESLSSCGAGSAAVICDGPEDCAAPTGQCCARVSFQMGASGTAPTTGGAECGSGCPGSVTMND